MSYYRHERYAYDCMKGQRASYWISFESPFGILRDSVAISRCATHLSRRLMTYSPDSNVGCEREVLAVAAASEA